MHFLIYDETTIAYHCEYHCHEPHLNVIGPASFAQTRLFQHHDTISPTLDKPSTTLVGMPFVYSLHPGYILSVAQLQHALQLVVNKHPSLHTSLIFDTQNNQLIQRIIHSYNQNNMTLFTFTQSIYHTHEQLRQILHDEKYNSQLFDLSQGLVFRCHLVYYKDIFSSNDLLSHQDVLIFNFHRAMFDLPSMDIFLRDLNQAYTTSQLAIADDDGDDDKSTLRYLDCMSSSVFIFVSLFYYVLFFVISRCCH